MGRLAHLRRTLPRLLEQFERIVLVDWSCPQESGQWARRAFGESVEVVQAPGNRYFHKTVAMNLGAQRASDLGAGWFFFVDADSFVEAGVREACEDCAKPGQFAIADRIWPGPFTIPSLTGVLLVSRDDFERVGGYDDAFRDYGSEDIEMRCRLRLLGGLTPVDLPPGLLTFVDHDEALRVRYYSEKSIRVSDDRNVTLLRERVRAWTQREFDGVSEIRDLLYNPHPLGQLFAESQRSRRSETLARIAASGGAPFSGRQASSDVRKSSWRRVGGRLVPRTVSGARTGRVPMLALASASRQLVEPPCVEASVIARGDPVSALAPDVAPPVASLAVVEEPRRIAQTAVVPVSAVIKATVLDTAYLAATVPHMLAQAQFEFAERTIVVDSRPEFTGRFRSLPRSTRADLDKVLTRLVSDQIVDRIVEVPSQPEDIASVMALYFGDEQAHRIPTHSTFGCAVFATLFGIGAAATDFVVQLDADMFFHADGTSWVAEGLTALDDPSVWLVMTHAGPPAGPLGTRQSLGRANADRAQWDDHSKTWRFVTASTRYFLTDRRRLRRRLAPLWRGNDVLPLEDCLSDALARHGAFRANLAREGSWDLHAFNHGAPFPEWADGIARCIERGAVPEVQRGIYDLRLDLAPFQRVWRPLVATAEGPRLAPSTSSQAGGGALPSRTR
jgi:hypothetical protein